MDISIGVLGAGSWGTALAILLSKKGYSVQIWGRDKELLDGINNEKENKKYLPNIKIPENLVADDDIENVIRGKDIILQAIPTHGVRKILNRVCNIIDEDQLIVNVSKGIENENLMRISQIVEELLPKNTYVVLSGPSHAEEVAINLPTTVIAASEDGKSARKIQDVFMTESFRVYTSNDVIGVELGGALKNVIALGAGIADGLGYGDNSKAALMNRGIFEMARLGEAMGADISTFSGLSGIGDLIVTCTSKHSRNRKAGLLLGKGLTIEQAIDETGMVVEGIRTTKSTYDLSMQYDVSMPITNEIYRVLYENGDVKESVKRLMLRDKKSEMDNLIEKDFYK